LIAALLSMYVNPTWSDNILEFVKC